MQGQTSAKKKVFVGMSGGVDSSVSAALLKERGFDVTGVFIKVWQPNWFECTWREDRLDAMRVAVELGIPFVTLDLEKEYKKEVVDYMISEYKAGRTPNPDIMCNRHVKFGGFFDWAMRQAKPGEEVFVATGHYAQIKNVGGASCLASGVDEGKDQSYFLWTLTSEQLSKTIFPVGGMPKAKVRDLARKFNLPTAEKRDSQGLCFIGKVDIREFLSHYIAQTKGDVLDESGKAIGTHDSAIFLTLGERHGFTVTQKTPDEKPYYITARDISKNTITVSHKSLEGTLNIEKKEYSLGSVNWIAVPPEAGKVYKARVRHLGELLDCHIEPVTDGEVEVGFLKPLIIASGQSIVLYQGDVCLGGGIVL
ncbi:MAG TPA: tRNA 2-thiouridine(34) synthase MnmA [Candidatus Paceibacterota bacterium]